MTRVAAVLLAALAAGCVDEPPAQPPLAGGSSATLVRLGDDMRRSGDPAAADGFYQAALNRDATSRLALERIGESRLAAGDSGQAESAFRAALAVDVASMPGSTTASVTGAEAAPSVTADATRGLGVALLRQGHPADALEALSGPSADPNDPRLLRDRGVAYDLLGRTDDAQASYRAGLRLAPLDSDLHANLALSLALSGDVDAARSEIRAATVAPGSSGRQAANAVLVLALTGDPDAARTAGDAAFDPASIRTLLRHVAKAAAIPPGTARQRARRAAALGFTTPVTATATGSAPTTGSPPPVDSPPLFPPAEASP